MSSIPPALDDVEAIARFGDDWLRGIERLSLPALLMASPLPGIADSIANIRDAVLADDPAATRRKVGWWGRLLGNDIEQQARATQLAADLQWLLARARAQLAALADHVDDLDRSHAALSALLVQMHAGIDAATCQWPAARQYDPLQAQASPTFRLASRLAHLGKLQMAHQLSLSHLDHQRRHLRLLHARYSNTLQQLAPLTAQRAMLRGGHRQQVAVEQARHALADVEQILVAAAEDASSHARPDRNQDACRHDDPGPDAGTTVPNDRSTLPSTDARNEHEH